MTTKPVYTLDQVIGQLDSGELWRKPTIIDAQTGIVIHPTITYSMTGIDRDARVEPGDGLAFQAANSIVPPMSQDTQDKIATAFELWDDLIAPNLQLTSDPNSDITFNFTCGTPIDPTDPGQQPLTYPFTDRGTSGNTMTGAEIWFPNAVSQGGQTVDFQDPTYGSHVFSSYIHEIGHSLGLNHPGPYDARQGENNIDYDKNPPFGAVYAQDTIQFSVMSYWKETHYADGGANYTVNGQQIEPQTPMLDDVAAVQVMYGADLTTRQGDTVYGFNSSFGTSGPGSVYNFNVNAHPVMCIYDAGGNDTLDCSGFNWDQIIDLQPGHFSSIGGLQNNVSMAFNQGYPGFNPDAVIENAVGGGGSDIIYGNDANNILDGGLGVDTLYGGAGDDTLIATPEHNAFGWDSMDGGPDNDTVDFSRYQDAVRIDLGAQAAWTTDGTDLNSGTLRKVASLFSIENVIGGGGNDEIRGDNGNNILDGGDNNDVLEGGPGGDVLDGGDGIDTASYKGATAGVEADLQESNLNWSSAGWGDAYGDTYISIENLRGSDFADSLDGDGNSNEIWGGNGADFIDGGANSDTLHGEDGNDVLIGGPGDDILIGGPGKDTFVFTDGWGKDTISDFEIGSDVLDMRAISGLTSLSQLTFENLYLPGGIGVSILYAGNRINIMGLDASQITPDMFRFADPAAGKTIWGARGQDLQGTSSDDTLIGREATMTGGAGNDTFAFYPAWGRDMITDFQIGSDVLDMSAIDELVSFKQLTIENLYGFNGPFGVSIAYGGDRINLLNIDSSQVTAAMFKFAAPPVTVLQESADLNVAYADASTATSGLYYALSGTGVQMAFGNAGNDVLDASGTADYHTMLYGGAGNDTLIPGSAGAYTLQGGPGDDTAVFSGNQGDYSIDGSPAGWPSWATVTDNATGAVNWLQGVEHLQFADGTIDTPGLPSGGNFNNVLFLDSSNPPASVGPNYDTVYVDDSHGPNPVHLSLAGTNVSFAYGGLGSDVFDATDVTSSVDLWGQWGNDVLIGGAGNDALTGDEWLPGGGNDWLDGGAGNDWLDGGNGDDTFAFRPGSGMDTVEDFDQSYPSPTSSTMVHTNDHDVIRFEDGLFANFDALVASGDMTQSGANVVIKYGATDQVTMLNVNLSQLGANDFVFDAGTASPPMPSGKTFDGTASWGGSIQGTGGVDTVSYANANYAIYVDLAHGYAESLTASPGPKEQLSSIENVTGSPNNLNYLHGDQNDNVLIGGNNFNWFEGGGGNNTLIGGTGTDLADYLGTNGPVTIDLPAGKVYHGNYVDTLSSIEQFRGTTFGDTFTGDAANDYYVSLGGNAKIYGGTGNNWFEVYSGDNTMVGGSGNDKLVAGTGSDVLTGGGGANTFVIGAHGAGHTEITDFNAAAGDRIDFSQNALVKQMSDLTVSDDGHGNAMLSYSASDGNGTVVLDLVAPTAVTAADFLHFTLPPSGEVAADQTIMLDSTFSGTVDFQSDTGTLKLENSSSFAGTVAGLCGQDAIDFADIGFGANSTLGYAANSDHSGGTLSVGDGTHMANIALLGSYMASTFVAASDGHGGTLISEAAQTSTQTPLVTQPHA